MNSELHSFIDIFGTVSLNEQETVNLKKITIPIIQRDYAQGRRDPEIERVRNRFLDALYAGLSKPITLDFIYGDIDKDGVMTPLDGQQRLTTLFLLHWYAAKKCGVEEDEYAFLHHFTYDIRPSSRDFCTHLMQYSPDWSLTLREQLTDQNWFMGEWYNGPTILSMLVMLDSINDKFGDIANLWDSLTGEKERIIFYFLPLSENGLSDELYIKMNSRGKKLTSFEHFKAEYENLYEKDSDEARTLNHKFDVEWADALFPYRNSDDIVDKEFMRYFFYISHNIPS